MSLISEKRDVQDQLINYLVGIGWTYLLTTKQHQIAHMLQTADAKTAAEQDRKAALQELFNSLLQELMTGKLRV